MPLVTFTSDLGLADYYVAVVKGTLLSHNPALNIIDISHNVKSFDIVQGAYILKNAYNSFPKGTIHLVSINDHYKKDRCFLAARYDGHYFIGPDNGIFSLIFEQSPDVIYELEGDPGVLAQDIFARAVKHISGSMPFNEIGILVDEIDERITFQPITNPELIKGTVVYSDNYENIIVNISKELFDKTGKKRKYNIYFKRFEPITKISFSYADVPIGETLCLFNSAGLLEIAINKGKAASLLGLNVEDGVHIEFY
ncbi:MAG: S-adenosylmethionine hydrolase [Saprospiraceae bacterium]|jgi:S-adenosylmethionine hydrolase